MTGMLVAGRGAVAGSFGIRAMTHDCIGLRISAEKAKELFPEGKIEFHFLLFYNLRAMGTPRFPKGPG